MTPVNTKSLLAFLFSQMEKLDNDQIDVNKASAQCKFIEKANSLIRSEHERSRVLMELSKHNSEFNSKIELREIESKNFD